MFHKNKNSCGGTSYCTHVYLPNVGTDEAVGGAASTKINKSTKKLANRLIAERKYRP